MRLRAVRLPVRVVAPVAQQLHAVAGLGAGDCAASARLAGPRPAQAQGQAGWAAHLSKPRACRSRGCHSPAQSCAAPLRRCTTRISAWKRRKVSYMLQQCLPHLSASRTCSDHHTCAPGTHINAPYSAADTGFCRMKKRIVGCMQETAACRVSQNQTQASLLVSQQCSYRLLKLYL